MVCFGRGDKGSDEPSVREFMEFAAAQSPTRRQHEHEVVGVTRIEPATSRPPDERANQAAPHHVALIIKQL